jgi:protein-S-isoprenylcysteine O-methyltransferase Ste14
MVHKGARVEWTDNTGVAGAAAAIPKVAPVISAPAIPVSEAPPKISETNSELTPSARYRNALGNVCLALLFFTALIPTKPNYHSPLANDIWLAGAVLMGVLSLVRVPARSAMVNPRSLLTTAAMMTIPAMMRPGSSTTGAIAYLAITIEVVGIAFTQISRIYLGRRFGLLPANRGIVAGGPFRIVRHPIYSGWLVLTIGYLMAYPTRWNIGIILISLPFLIWRIDLEEEHLTADPEYRAYLAKTRYRLIPGIY